MRDEVTLQAVDGSLSRFHLAVAFCRHKYTAIARSTCGTSNYPCATPPSRVVRTGEHAKCDLALKGIFHDLEIFSCNFGKNATEAECAQSHALNPGTNRPAMSAQVNVTTQAQCSWLPGKAQLPTKRQLQTVLSHPKAAAQTNHLRQKA